MAFDCKKEYKEFYMPKTDINRMCAKRGCITRYILATRANVRRKGLKPL